MVLLVVLENEGVEEGERGKKKERNTPKEMTDFLTLLVHGIYQL